MKALSLIALANFTLALAGDALAAAASPEPKKAPSAPAVQIPTTSITPAQRAMVKSALMKQPLRFVKNQGQFHTDHIGQQVQFYEQRKGHAIYFTQDGVYLHLVKFKDAPVKREIKPGTPEIAAKSLIKLSLIGSAERPEIIPERLQPGKVNYYPGSDSKRWFEGIPTFGAIRYSNVYKGVDVRYYGNDSQLEYDVIVKPGAGLEQVRFSYEGIEGLRVTAEGSLEIAVSGGKIVQKKPYIYQELEGRRVVVDGGFRILKSTNGEFTYGFEVDSYDRAHDLVIDPTLVYSLYLGGSLDDTAWAVAADGDGNAYITGTTWSTDFPTLNAYQPALAYPPDTFVTKIDTSGAMVYSTYLSGGVSYGIAVDAARNAYITGSTNGVPFPALNPLHSGLQLGAFVARLNESGVLDYATTLGPDGADTGHGIAVDGDGNIYVTGATRSKIFPTSGGFQANLGGLPGCDAGGYPCPWDAFVTKINANGALVYSSYLGGTDHDYGYGIAVDGAGFAYITGQTCSGDFYTTFLPQQGYCDAFVTKVDNSGSRLSYSTYLGGNDVDWGYGIAIDSAGNAYVTGATGSGTFPTTPNAIKNVLSGIRDAFVTKLNALGDAFDYSTYLGGGGDDWGYAIAVDADGNAYITGETSSADFPTRDPFQAILGSTSYDAFVTELDAWGTIVFSTFLGGNGLDSGRGIAADGAGHVYVAGPTQSTDFPVSDHSGAAHGGWDAFVIRLTFGAPQILSYSAESGFSNGLSPSSGTTSTVFTYKGVFTDATGIPPAAVNVCIDASCYGMTLDTSAAANLWDGNYTNGEQYAFSATLTAGTHSYHFEASDGTTTTTLPASGNVTGPTAVSVPVISATVPYGAQGVPYNSGPPSVSGGTGPYTWSATDLPAEFTIDPATGVISGSSPVEGVYTVTVTVTDANGYSASQTFTITINAYTTPPPAQVFDLIDLGTLGGAWSQAVAMNSKGEVTGYSQTASGFTHAFLYSNGVMKDLGTLPGGFMSWAVAINDAGQVAGQWDNNSTGERRGFLYSNDVMTDLGGKYYVFVSAMNKDGHVVGWGGADGPTGSAHAFLYRDGTMKDLGSLGGDGGGAYAINDLDQVVGQAQMPANSYHAFLYNNLDENPKMKDLGILPVPGASYGWSRGTAINSSGQVAGVSNSNISFAWHAFLWSAEVMTDLGTLGGAGSYANAMNDAGQVVGWADTATGARHAYLYTNQDIKKEISDLGTLGGASSSAVAINSAGQVVGSSSTVYGPRAFIYNNGAMKYISPSSTVWQAIETAVAINDNGQIAGNGKINGQFHAFVTASSAVSADLAVNISANPATVAVGSPVTLTATISNGGPGSATNVSFTGLETIVSVASAITVTASQGSCAPVAAGSIGTPITCTLGTIASNAYAQIAVVATLTAAAAPLPGNNSVGMVADVTATEPDSNTANNHFDGSFNARQAQADVALTITADPTTVTVGSPVTLTATITNNGPDPATHVRFAGLEKVVSVSSAVTVSAGRQGSCYQGVDPDVSDTPQIYCSFDSIGSGASAQIAVVATLTSAAAPLPGNNSVGMVADVTAAEPDPNTANNHFTGSFNVRQLQADVALTITANPTTAVVGSPLTFTVTISNNGPDPATNVVFSGFDGPSLAGFTGLSYSSPHCRGDSLGSGISCSIGTLRNGGGEVVTITATPTATVPGLASSTTVSSTFIGSVSATELDPVSANNSASVPIDVTRPPGQFTDGTQALSFSTPQSTITLSFTGGVTSPGFTSVAAMTSVPKLPAGFEVNGVAYNITTSAQYTAPVTVCFSGSFTESDWIMHVENSVGVKLSNQKRLPVGDPPYSTICAQTQTLSPFVVARELNRPPSANAGMNQVLDATSAAGAKVTLIGSGSDPDLDSLTFSWSGPCGSASTAVATLTCPIGVSTMTLTVNDGRGGSASATVVITVLGPMDIKNSVLGDLTALRATVTNRQDGAKLDDAIARLTDSLDASLWIDQTHLDSQLGDQVFDAEKKCAGKLQELSKGRRKTTADAVLQAFINRIALADRLLALIAISDAQQQNGDPRRIALANDQVAKGDGQAARGLSKEAIDFYRSAWRQVT